jgi:PPOX class probable F420-dependent enzyme
VPGDASATPSHALRGEAVLADAVVSELLAARLVAVIATLEPDGSVHAVPLWFALGDKAVVFATGSGSRKVQNLTRDPRATVVLHDSRPGFEVCGASLRGRAEVVAGRLAKPLIESVHTRYVTAVGLELGEAQEFLSGDDVALVFRPEAASTWDERTNPATVALRQVDGSLPLLPTTPRP